MTDRKTVSPVADNIFISTSPDADGPQLTLAVIISLTGDIGVQPECIIFAEAEFQPTSNRIVIFLCGEGRSGVGAFVQCGDAGTLPVQRTSPQDEGQCFICQRSPSPETEG